MIAIVNYGLGNIRAFANLYKHLNMEFVVASKSSDFRGVEKIILPGVGAFDTAMNLLNQSGMRESLNELVFERKVPILGICVGMQMLARSSEEGTLPGLGWVEGVVKRFEFPKPGPQLRHPHMGWNNVTLGNHAGLFSGLPDEPRFYFLHSYYFKCDATSFELGQADYGGPFSCIVGSQNIFGVQFHPEKSHNNGLQLLKNFGNLKTC